MAQLDRRILRQICKAVLTRTSDSACEGENLGKESLTQYSAPAEEDEALARVFSRIGLVGKRGNKRAIAGTVEETLFDFAEACGEDAAEIRKAFLSLSGGFASQKNPALCLEAPLCASCPVAEHCRYFNKKPTITDLPEDERPRERLIKDGEASLTNAELLAIIIQKGTEEETAIDIAETILSKFGDFRAIGAKSVAELCRIKGIGPAKAAQIKAALEISRRYSSISIKRGRQFTSSKDVFDHYCNSLGEAKKELFCCVLLDTKNRYIKDVVISEGSLSASVVHPREVFNPAIRESAAAVIFVHNHPSGDPSPSREDIEITRRLKECGELLGIKVLDHVIVGSGGYISFVDKKLV